MRNIVSWTLTMISFFINIYLTYDLLRRGQMTILLIILILIGIIVFFINIYFSYKLFKEGK